MTGAERARLDRAVDDADDVAVGNTASDWQTAAKNLRAVASGLRSAAQSGQGIGGRTGPAMFSTMEASADRLVERAAQVEKGSQALTKSADAIARARRDRDQIDQDPNYKPYEATDYTPPPGNDFSPGELRRQTRLHEESEAGLAADREAAREARAREIATQFEDDYQEPIAVMSAIYGYEPPPPPPPQESPFVPGGRTPITPVSNLGGPEFGDDGGNGGEDGGDGGDGGDGTGTDDPGTDDPGTDDPGTDDPGTDDPGSDDPGTDDPGQLDIGGFGDDDAAGSNGTGGGIPGGVLGGVAAGALGGAAIAGVVRGGGISAVASSLSAKSAAVIGGGTRAAAPSTLGRGAVAGTGSPVSRSGAAGRTGAGATGRGAGVGGQSTRAGGRGGGAAGRGGPGGRAGAGAGAGARSGGTGAGAGRGRGRKDDDQQRQDLTERDRDEWLDDDGVAPSVLD